MIVFRLGIAVSDLLAETDSAVVRFTVATTRYQRDLADFASVVRRLEAALRPSAGRLRFDTDEADYRC